MSRTLPVPKLLIGISAFLSFGVVPSARAQTSYTFTDLGLLPGSIKCYPKAMNDPADPNQVEVVGLSFSGTSVLSHGFYWSKATGMVDVGVLGTGSYSLPAAINSRGEVIGRSKTAGSNYDRAFYWNRARGAKNPLDLPTPGGTTSDATGINDAGVIVGNAGGLGMVWTPSAIGQYPTAVPLSPLPGHDHSAAQGINNAGRIVGKSTNSITGAAVFVVWDPDAQGNYSLPMAIPGVLVAASDVSRLNANGQAILAGSPANRTFFWDGGSSAAELTPSNNTQAAGLNASGQVSGFTSDSASARRAFRWQDGIMTVLPTLGGTENSAGPKYVAGYLWSSAINNAGTVVGYSFLKGDRDIHGFVWDPVKGTRDLNTLVVPSLAKTTAIQDASSITGHGWICGSVLVKSVEHPYVLTPNP